MQQSAQSSGGGMSALKILLIIGGSLFALSFFSCVVCAGWTLSLPEDGVRVGSEVHEYAHEYLDENDLLEPGEEVVAYYDRTYSMTGEEAIFITDRRVVAHDAPKTDSIPLEEIEDIQHFDEELGTVLGVTSEDGDYIKLTVDPFLGGDVFYDVLERERDRAQGHSDRR